MPSGQRPNNLRKSSLTLDQLAERAGNASPRYTPLILSVEPIANSAWLRVVVSIAPGNRVEYRVNRVHYDPATIAAVLRSSTPLFLPAGLTSDLYTPEE